MITKLKNAKIITIKTDEENPMPVELIAENIKKVADSFSKALNSGLTKQAICLLIQNAMPASQRISVTDINNVLVWASNLRKYVTK